MLNLIILLVAACAIVFSFVILWKANSISTNKKLEIAEETSTLERLKEEKENFNVELNTLQKAITETNEQYNKAVQEMNEKMRQQQKTINEGLSDYTAAIERSKKEVFNKFNFEKTQAETDLNFYLQSIEEQKQEKEKELSSLRQTIDVVNAQIQKEREAQDMKNKYLIQVNDGALQEIEILRSVENRLEDPRPLRMIIWQSYFSKPANELCSRVLGKEEICGIYKITNVKTKMCYIGQAKSVKTRWREHMKCGLGIDTPAGNKLYAAMLKDGIENFSFELLETCSPADLNEKERTYIDIFSSYDFGYNSNKGISKKEK